MPLRQAPSQQARCSITCGLPPVCSQGFINVDGPNSISLSNMQDTINSVQGTYVLTGYILCQNGPNPGIPEFTTTPPLTLIYDTLPPSLMTDVHTLLNTPHPPGSLVAVTFSEPLLCAQPAPWCVCARGLHACSMDPASACPWAHSCF